MTAAQQRKVQRGVHLTAALVLIGYLYAPIGAQLQDVVRFVVLSGLVVTGIAMWQAARIRRLWRTLGRGRALDLATSASPAGRGGGTVDVARATTGGRGVNVWAFLMLVGGGLFAGGVTALAWDRLPAWRSMPLAEFRTDFAGVVQRADRAQPGLLVVAIVASFAFGLRDAGAARILALIGASGFLATLIGSVAVLVPLQRRMISSSSLEPGALERMRRRWFRGHLGRTVVGVASFLLVASAAAV